jgi:hypothetical protein
LRRPTAVGENVTATVQWVDVAQSRAAPVKSRFGVPAVKNSIVATVAELLAETRTVWDVVVPTAVGELALLNGTEDCASTPAEHISIHIMQAASHRGVM